MKIAPFAALAAATLLAGCSRGSETWHCENAAKHSCSQWKEPDADTRRKQQANCTGMGGTVGEGPCPAEGVIGSCTAADSADSRIVYYAPRAPADAQTVCGKLGGIWR